MKVRIIASLIAAVLMAHPAHAEWTSAALVEQLNPGGNGQHGTFIRLEGVTFIGCTENISAFVSGANPNYREIVALLVAAKFADKLIKFGYSGCTSGYATVTEVSVP